MPPTAEARTADRAIACLRKAIEELAAGRPRDALAMVANAQGSVLALRGMIGELRDRLAFMHQVRAERFIAAPVSSSTLAR
jgi:hypothetical protein